MISDGNLIEPVDGCHRTTRGNSSQAVVRQYQGAISPESNHFTQNFALMATDCDGHNGTQLCAWQKCFDDRANDVANFATGIPIDMGKRPREVTTGKAPQAD